MRPRSRGDHGRGGPGVQDLTSGLAFASGMFGLAIDSVPRAM
jgi:hypothetical protein